VTTGGLQPALQAHRLAIMDFLSAACAVPARRWTEPRATGKWSAGQVVEHVVLSYEVNRGVLRGMPPPMTAPRWVRPLIRRFLLQPVLRRGRFFPGSRSPKALRPSPVPGPPEPLIDRFQAAASAFEADATALGHATIEHPFFGRLPVGDFVRLQEIHTRHHRGQLSAAG